MTPTQLDSHANMVVVGKYATIINQSGKIANLRTFSSDCSKLEAVPIIDAVVEYDCPHTLETFILVVQNGLYVHSMMNNLIPPFVMIEAGLKVNDVPKIHIDRQKLTNEIHCIVSTADNNGTEVRIPMQLDVIFSYFTMQKLTQEKIDKYEYIETVYLTPDEAEWDTYDEDYSESEDESLDFRGIFDRPPTETKKLLDDSDIYQLQVS